MEWFRDHYVGTAEDFADPLMSPIKARDLSGVAPAFVATAEFDPLRDEGNAYADALRAAGVEVDAQEYPGLIHGFFDLGPFSAAAKAATIPNCASSRRRASSPSRRKSKSRSARSRRAGCRATRFSSPLAKTATRPRSRTGSIQRSPIRPRPFRATSRISGIRAGPPT